MGQPPQRSTYKGDSPGKKLSRFRTWLAMIDLGITLEIPFDGAVVLGGEGGDLSVLQGLKTDMRAVTAVDFDRDWLDYNAQVYGCRTVQGELGAISKYLRYNVAHIDFCGGLSIDNILTVADVAQNARETPALIAVTMLKGRESKQKAKGHLLRRWPRSRRRYVLGRYRKAHPTIGDIPRYLLRNVTEPLDARELLRLAEKDVRATPWPDTHMGVDDEGNPAKGTDIFADEKRKRLGTLGTAMVRATAMRRCVETILHLEGSNRALFLSGVFGYHSRNRKGAHGTPFMTALYIIHDLTQEWQARRIRDTLLRMTANCRFHSLDISDSLSYLQPTAVELAKTYTNEEVAKLFDIKPSTVVAWKAHVTRDTYSQKPLIRVDERGLLLLDPYSEIHFTSMPTHLL